MNKTNLIFCLIFLSSCSTKLFVATDNAHIISDSKGTMYYSNNHYNFHSEINIEQDNNNIDTVINKRTKRILQLAKFNKKQDTILFTGRSGLLVLKANATNLNKFKIINLYDTVLSKYPYNYWKVNFYRQIIIDKKHKTYIINDLIPFKNKFLQKLEYNETDYNAYVDPTDLNDIVSYYNFYIKSIPQTKETYLSTLGKSTVKFSNPFDLFNNLFLKDTLFNYNAAYNAQKKAYNYYSSPNKDFFRQILATYYSLADNSQKADSVWFSLSGRKDTCDCRQTGAYNDLLKIILQNQVVMFNEAHHVPTHRLLLYNMLDTLYMQGFRYLALEALTSDSIFEKTGYLSADNGFYLPEPTLANTIRKAYKLGFQVFGYDSMDKNRDSIQANNIYNQTIKKDSTAKVIVWAGWGHIDRHAMAGKFEKISGIKSLTIDQTRSYNFCRKDNEKDIVYIFQPTSNTRGVGADLYLFNNLNLFEKYNYTLTIPDDVSEFCKMVCIYNENEYYFVRSNNKIPVPCSVVATNGNESVNLNLEKGIYIAFLQDNFGNTLKKYRLTVK